MDADKLRRSLEDRLGPVSVEPVAADAFSVRLPMSHLEHAGVWVSVERDADEWVISDLGWLAETVGADELEEFVETLQCAGSLANLQDGLLVIRADSESEIARMTIHLAHQLAGAEVVRNALECRASGPAQRVESPTAMAQETKRELLKTLGRKADPYVRVNPKVAGPNDTADANLAVMLPGGRNLQPRLVASCIDFTVTKSSLTSTKQRTSHLLVVTRGLEISKWVIVRGDRDEVARKLYGAEASVFEKDAPNGAGAQFERDTQRALAALGID